MATLYITECNDIAFSLQNGQVVMAPQMPPVTEQHITISGSSTASAAFNVGTRYVLLNTDATCSLAWSANATSPTAAATAQRMAANETRLYGVSPGGKLAVITNS